MRNQAKLAKKIVFSLFSNIFSLLYLFVLLIIFISFHSDDETKSVGEIDDLELLRVYGRIKISDSTEDKSKTDSGTEQNGIEDEPLYGATIEESEYEDSDSGGDMADNGNTEYMEIDS